jgi:hypothetical protein
MKVNIPLELSEHDLRRVRAGIGRSGTATRKETRIWVDRVVRDALAKLPEPQLRRARPSPSPSPSVDPTPDSRCVHCGRTKQEHLPMGGCPQGLKYRRSTRFALAVPA